MKYARLFLSLSFIFFVFEQNVNAQTTYYANSVSGNDTNNGLSPAAAKKTFTAAFNTAAANDIIDLTGTFTWTDAGESNDVTLGFTINKNIVITGKGADQTIIQANATPDIANRRVFTINSGNTVLIENLTIRNGKVANLNNTVSNANGGAILNNGNLTLTYCRIAYNYAIAGPSLSGGAAGGVQHNGNNTLNIYGCTFDHNEANNGGALSNNSNNVSGHFIITNSTFAYNKQLALVGTVGGGAIWVLNGNNIITNCTFSFNDLNNSNGSGAGNGAAILIRQGTVRVKNNIFAENTRSGALLPSGRNEIHSSGGTLVDEGNNIFGRQATIIGSTSFSYSTSSWYDSNSSTSLNGSYLFVGNNAVTGQLNIDNTLNQNSSVNYTLTLAINAGSIATNNGSSTANNGIQVPLTDQRGFQINSTRDIGAFEFDGLVPPPDCNDFLAEAPTLDNNVYQVSTFKHLRWISENSSSWAADFIQTGDIDAFITNENCYNSGAGWLPIGNVSTKFTGSYDGDGNTISNLFINRPNNQRIALFGETNGATIERLGLVDPDITVTGTGNFSTGSNVGSLVGLADNGTTISQCFATGGSVTAGGSGVGGLIGQLLWSSLTDSYGIVAVEGGDAGMNYSAGLVGVNSSSTITNCYAAGSVAFKQYSGSTVSRGLTQGSNGITNSFYDSDATGQSTGGGTAKTTAEMQQQATYTNWDFQCEVANGTANFWGIDEANDYPRLSWEGFTQDCTVQWTGTISSDWNDAGNWSNQEGPNIFSIPVITNVANQPTAANNIEVAALQINSGSSLTMQALTSLKVNGNITNNGQIIFKSDASGSGMFDVFTGTITGSGTVQVERYIPAKRAFRFLTSAVTTTGSSTIRANWQNNGVNTTGLGTHITGTGSGFDATATNNPSMFTYTNGAWAPVTSTLGVLTAGTPYRLMVRGDRTTDLTNNAASSSITTLRATGALYTGDFMPALNLTALGYSFIGNPYQAPIDIKAVLTNSATNMNTGVLYYWDPTLNTRGGYVTRNLSSNQNSNMDVNSIGTSLFTEILQPGQAVIVKSSAANPTMTIAESHKRVSQGAAGIFRNASMSSGVGILRANLQANTDNQWQTIEGALAIFNDDYNWSVTPEDATKMGNLDEEVSFMLDGTALAIAFQNEASVTSALPIQINKMRHTDYQWTFDLDNYNGLTPMLWDEQTQTMTAITNNTVVPFSTTATATDRFKIVFQETMHVDDFSLNVTLYPNPGKSNQSFYLSGITDAKVSMQSLLGQEIPVTTHQNGQTMEVKPQTVLSTGVYFVRITQAGKTAQVKWIVE